jgi:hypothetical protein
LDIHLLKPSRVWAEVAFKHAPGSQQVICNAAKDDQLAGEWIHYLYRTAHPILRWLPTKLAEWIGDNYGDALGIPARNHANAWTVGELNNIRENNLVA